MRWQIRKKQRSLFNNPRLSHLKAKRSSKHRLQDTVVLAGKHLSPSQLNVALSCGQAEDDVHLTES